jgi:ankyrin repeat protein
VVQAAGVGYTDILQQLCGASAKLSLTSRDGGTALNEAADFGQAAAVHFLLEHGALVNQRGEADRTALIDGAAHPDVVRALLSARADINLQAADGVTALMVAAVRNVPESVELLLKGGADTSIKDREGRTALDIAKQKTLLKLSLC